MKNKFRKKIEKNNIDAIQNCYNDFKNIADKTYGYISAINQRIILKQNKLSYNFISILIIQGHVYRISKGKYFFKNSILLNEECIKICQLIYKFQRKYAANHKKKKNKLTVTKQKIYKETFWQKLINLFKK